MKTSLRASMIRIVIAEMILVAFFVYTGANEELEASQAIAIEQIR